MKRVGAWGRAEDIVDLVLYGSVAYVEAIPNPGPIMITSLVLALMG